MALRSLDIAASFSAPPRVPSLSTSRSSIRVSSSYRSSSLASTSGSECETNSNSVKCCRRQGGSIGVSSSSRSSSFASTSGSTNSNPVKCSRRQGISLSILLGLQVLNPSSVLAEENAKKEEGGTFVDGVLELLDPDQVTKTGKKLPKKYVKSVREVVKNLRESFAQDSNDGAKFRRNADSAKEAIREYLQNWRGSKIVETEDSYIALERAFRELGKFYSSKGPQAALPEDIRNRVLEDLNKADDSI